MTDLSAKCEPLTAIACTSDQCLSRQMLIGKNPMAERCRRPPLSVSSNRVVHEGVAFPLVWTMLNKKGNSHHKERIKLLEEFRAMQESKGTVWLGRFTEIAKQVSRID
jgi:hypothetical protein